MHVFEIVARIRSRGAPVGMRDGGREAREQLVEHALAEVMGDLRFLQTRFVERERVEAAAICIARLREKRLAPKQQKECPQVVDLVGIGVCEQIGIDTRDASELSQVKVEKFLRARPCRLPIQAPDHAVGKDSPLHGAVGRYLGAAQVTQHLARRRASAERITGIPTIERWQPPLRFDN